jgi:hypothetical protein
VLAWLISGGWYSDDRPMVERFYIASVELATGLPAIISTSSLANSLARV